MSVSRTAVVMRKLQGGYILLLVMLFIAILMVAGGYFFVRMTSHTQESGGMRDLAQSTMLAESALNYVLGLYKANVDNDSSDGTNLSLNMGDPAGLSAIQAQIPYLYYVTDSSNTVIIINQTVPSLLQVVANGEAANAKSTPLISPQVSTTVAVPLRKLRINDLFIQGSPTRPKLFRVNAAGLLQVSSHTTWNNETATEKAAVWLEAIQNPKHADVVDIYIQAVAEVDGVKSYVQRYADGSKAGAGVLGGLAAINSSSL